MDEITPTSQSSDCVTATGPDSVAQLNNCVTTADAHYCAATALDSGVMHHPEHGSFVAVMMTRRANGLILHLTPDGARQLAACIVKSAAQVDDIRAAASADQLAAVLNRGNSNG